MTRIYAFRHGESVCNLETHLIGGQSNWAPLTARGRKQSQLAGEWIAANIPNIDFAVSSTAVRTQQTGKIALSSAGLELELELYDDLLELSQGPFEGMPRDEVYTPERMIEIQRDGFDFKLPDAESMRDVGTRKGNCLIEIAQKFPDQTGVAFIHGTGIRSVAGLWLGMTHLETHRTPTDNLSLTTLDIEDGIIDVLEIGRQVIANVPATITN
ncbi:histidine phosphatase family protein [Candidatus Saccharibacteria bacterium]|nr:histidine phosphatase family protein [Candidatus Saccharibacteria bacterium]